MDTPQTNLTAGELRHILHRTPSIHIYLTVRLTTGDISLIRILPQHLLRRITTLPPQQPLPFHFDADGDIILDTYPTIPPTQ